MSDKGQKIFGITLTGFLVFEIIAFIVMWVNGFVGKSAYYLFFGMNIIFVICGLFVLLISSLNLALLIIPFARDFDSYKYKRKKGFTKKGRKEIKGNLIAIGICFGGFLVGLGFSYFGITRGYQCTKDIGYARNPIVVEMTNCQLEHTYSWGRYNRANRYTLTGEDYEKNKYEFKIGKYPSWLEEYYTDDIIHVTYLPNTKIVFEISK